jgi:Flp pilus assembly protein TadG
MPVRFEHAPHNAAIRAQAGAQAASNRWPVFPEAPRRAGVRGLWRDQAGASLVEFALIALPFFILLYGTFELGFVYWANQELENAAGYGARLVRTGQVQAGGLNQAQLTTAICSQTAVLVGCTSKLRLDVRSAATLGEITAPVPVNGGGGLKDPGEFTFSPGAANDVVLVTTFYQWPRLLSPSDPILRAASVGRNEPF